MNNSPHFTFVFHCSSRSLHLILFARIDMGASRVDVEVYWTKSLAVSEDYFSFDTLPQARGTTSPHPSLQSRSQKYLGICQATSGRDLGIWKIIT